MGVAVDLESAARTLRVHYQTAYRWVRTGVLPAVKVGSEYEIDSRDVAEFLNGRWARRATVEPGADPDLVAAELALALVAGDEDAARSLVAAVHQSGTSPLALCETVIAPAIREIAGLRESGGISAAEGRVATAICERIVGVLAFPPRGRPRGAAVIAAPEGARHRLPGLVAVVALRSDRWRVHDLGVNVPALDVIDFVSDRTVDLVVLAAPVGHRGADGVRAAIQGATAVPVLLHDPEAPLGDLVRTAHGLRVIETKTR
jgi:excisionase family DNA binding protein